MISQRLKYKTEKNRESPTVLFLKEFADSLNIQYVETSAKCTTNVEEAFKMIVFGDKMIQLSNPKEIPKANEGQNIGSIESTAIADSN